MKMIYRAKNEKYFKFTQTKKKNETKRTYHL